MKRFKLDDDDEAVMTIDVQARDEKDADPMLRRLVYRDLHGNLWCDGQSAAAFFKVSFQRLGQWLCRRDMPEGVRGDLQGRPTFNATLIEAWLIEGRGQAGPLPVFVAALIAAGKIERPTKKPRTTAEATKARAA